MELHAAPYFSYSAPHSVLGTQPTSQTSAARAVPWGDALRMLDVVAVLLVRIFSITVGCSIPARRYLNTHALRHPPARTARHGIHTPYCRHSLPPLLNRTPATK